MQPTVKSMRQGSKLLIGKYSVDKNAEPQPVAWTKATPNGDFIASCAIDFLAFDAKEIEYREDGTTRRSLGNPDYSLSNIHTFLNSAGDEWYVPKHELDMPPTRNYTDIGGGVGVYTEHYGFLKFFEDYELSCILQQSVPVNGVEVMSQFRLPTSVNIFGDAKFNLFKKGGVRAHPSRDFVDHRRNTGYTREEQFVPYFLADKHERFQNCVNAVDRTGYLHYQRADNSAGIRPVCRVRLDAKVEEIEAGVYELVPYDVVPMEIVTNEELIAFLGLV